MCLLLATLGEKGRNQILYLKNNNNKNRCQVQKINKTYILSRCNSSFIDFPGAIIDSKKEALLEVQPQKQD